MTTALKDALKKGIFQAYKQVPELGSYLSAESVLFIAQSDELKTYDYFLRHIRGLVNGVYAGNVAGEFVDVMANLISGQLQDAYEKAWIADGNDLPLPDYLNASFQEAAANQYSYVDQFYRDIVDARIDKTSVAPLLARADMWANRFNEATSEAARLIALENGGKMVWRYGEAEHCVTCQSLNGLVAYAKEFETAGFRPQNAPNPMLECGGWKCKCRLEPTDRRRSPKVLDTLLNIGMMR